MNYSITEISNVLEVTGGHIIDEDAIVSQLLTDSRSLTQPEETIFFALRTEADDGHNYKTTGNTVYSCQAGTDRCLQVFRQRRCI